MIDAGVDVAWYVYGVVAAGAPLDSELLAKHELRLVERHGLAAVVGPVDADDFAEDRLAERLNDRAWLEEKVRMHEDVLDELFTVVPVVPLRFGAIYHQVEDVAELLEARRPQLEAALARVGGRIELGVKAWLDRSRLETVLARGEDTTSTASPGRAYLQRRSEQREVEAEASALAREIAAAAHERLAGCAEAAVSNRPQSRELTGRPEQMLLNAAYLVRDDDTSLAAAVAALNTEYASVGLEFELTGPWPPYNFVGRDAP